MAKAGEAAHIAMGLGYKEALSYCVEAIAAAAAMRGDAEVATRLLAAADAARSELSVTLDPFEEHVDREARMAARRSLSPERYEAVWAEGVSLTLDEAIALALDVPRRWGGAVG